MRPVIVLLLLIAATTVRAQPEIHATLTGDLLLVGLSAQLRPVTAPGGGSRSAGLSPPLGADLGLEAVWRKAGRTITPFACLSYGSLIGSGLTNTVRGSGSQTTAPERMGVLYAQTRLEGASFGQFTVGAEFLHVPKWRNFRLGAGLGGMLFLRERIHAAVSWIDPDTGLAEPGDKVYRIGNRTLTEEPVLALASQPAGSLNLSQTMLNRFTPYAELRGTVQQGERFTLLIALQLGLRPVFNEDQYTNPPGWQSYFNLKIGGRGRIF